LRGIPKLKGDRYVGVTWTIVTCCRIAVSGYRAGANS
jgi:hypothetical protein